MSPSPDLSPFIDLTIYDKQPQDLFEEALAAASLKMPQWQPREGNVENIILEAMAWPIAELLFAINRLPGGIMQVLLQMYDIFRDFGSQPVIDVTYDVVDDTGYTIPIGSATQLSLIYSLEPITFFTDTELVIPAGSTSGTVSATGDQFSVNANAQAVPTDLSLIDAFDFVNSAQMTALTTPGIDPETDEQYLSRGSQRLAQISAALCLPLQYQAAALENPAVNRAIAIDDWDPDSGNDPGEDGGHITVGVYGFDTAVDAGVEVTLEGDLIARSQSNLQVHILDATVTPVDVECTVIPIPNIDPATVVLNVTGALTQYLDTDTWNWDSTVRVNNLLAVIGSADGVAYVQSLDDPLTDVTLDGIVAQLATAGTITVNTV